MDDTALNSAYWNERYHDETTPWDLEVVSPPLKSYLDQLGDREMRILIPGAGNAHEAEYARKAGFEQVFVLDWAALAIQNFQKRCPDFPQKHLITGDFFQHEGVYDLILEQTFFCALPPAMRPDYVRKVADLLAPGGKLVGLMFDFPLVPEGPPFGGSPDLYVDLFSSKFSIAVLEQSNNSAPSRFGKELFVIMKKRR